MLLLLFRMWKKFTRPRPLNKQLNCSRLNVLNLRFGGTHINLIKNLMVQSCKLYNNKYMITSTQITNTENFAFIAFLVFKLLSRKVLFMNRKDNRNH